MTVTEIKICRHLRKVTVFCRWSLVEPGYMDCNFLSLFNRLVNFAHLTVYPSRKDQ